MRKHRHLQRGCTRTWWAWALLAAATVGPVGARGADRIVLGEEFSANW